VGQYSSVLLQSTVDEKLGAQIKDAAAREGLSVSAYIRRLLTIWHDPDGETLRLAANSPILVDPGVEYVTGEGE
jgi:hypothetical protein